MFSARLQQLASRATPLAQRTPTTRLSATAAAAAPASAAPAASGVHAQSLRCLETLAVSTSATASPKPLSSLSSLIPKVVHASRSSAPAGAPSALAAAAGPSADDIHSVSLRTLLAANLHLGHNTELWNPAMLPYIHGSRHGIHIINLEHTLAHLRRAAAFIRHVSLAGGNVVFLGTRPAIHKLVVDAAIAGDAFYITHWIGGTITNKERVLRRSVGYDPSQVVQTMAAAATALDAAPARDAAADRRKRPFNNSKAVTGAGYRKSVQAADAETEDVEDDLAEADASDALPKTLKKQPYVHTPDVLVVLDYVNNLWAVREANVARVPVVAICDTNTDPSLVQYPIPANDDSITGLELLAGVLSKASRDGSMQRVEQLNAKRKQARAPAAPTFRY
ncbi:ribosomal protein S2, flavodoxin-like domain-containing protein [Entophlyctis helioformis]|nr:ribosomal protein S2, flavodoxin-like domain-containing protein [Entophlyctis helioformis]